MFFLSMNLDAILPLLDFGSIFVIFISFWNLLRRWIERILIEFVFGFSFVANFIMLNNFAFPMNRTRIFFCYAFSFCMFFLLRFWKKIGYFLVVLLSLSFSILHIQIIIGKSYRYTYIYFVVDVYGIYK